MEWHLILVTGLFSFPIALTVILKGPTSAVYPEGSNVTLQCLAERTNRIVWEDIIENIVIFIDKTKNTRKVKFDNFVLSNAEDNFSLTIINAQLSDEGFYSCKEGDDKRSANVIIEAGPDLSILVNNTAVVPESLITITEHHNVSVMCKADGAKPPVYLKLKFGESEWIKTNITTQNEGLRFTTETRIVHRVTRTDTTVTCQATGQTSIPPSTTIISINVLYKPICVIELIRNVAKCQCVSNPAVSTYNWYINGEPQSTDPSLTIQEYKPANITCLGINGVGTSSLTSRYVSLSDFQSDTSTTYVAIIIAAVVVCVIVICVLLLIILLHKRFKHASKNLPYNGKGPSDLETSNGEKAIGETQGLDNIDEHIALNPGREEMFYDAKVLFKEDDQGSLEQEQRDEEVMIDPGVTQLIPTITAIISHDWEIFAIEDLRLKPEIVKAIVREHHEVSDQLSAALSHWGKSCPEATMSYLEKEILSKSEVFNYCREHPNQNLHGGESNAASGEQFPQVATFPNLLKEVTKCVGHVGAYRLSFQYREEVVDTFTTTLTGENIIKFLQNKTLLTDDMESLKRLKRALDDSFLLRASDLVDTYTNEKEKPETNISSTQTVL